MYPVTLYMYMYAHTTVVMQCFWVVCREISHKWHNFSKYTHDPLDDWKNMTNLQLTLYFWVVSCKLILQYCCFFQIEKTCGKPPAQSLRGGNYRLSVLGSSPVATYRCSPTFILKVKLPLIPAILMDNYNISCNQTGWSRVTLTCGEFM